MIRILKFSLMSIELKDGFVSDYFPLRLAKLSCRKFKAVASWRGLLDAMNDHWESAVFIFILAITLFYFKIIIFLQPNYMNPDS